MALFGIGVLALGAARRFRRRKLQADFLFGGLHIGCWVAAGGPILVAVRVTSSCRTRKS